jgi:hypothetical protein
MEDSFVVKEEVSGDISFFVPLAAGGADSVISS